MPATAETVKTVDVPCVDASKCHAATSRKRQCTYDPAEGSQFCTRHIKNQPNGVVSANGNGGGSPPSDPRAAERAEQDSHDQSLLARAQAILDGKELAVPDGWQPDEETVQRETSTTFSYVAHNGTRVKVSAMEFQRMQRGLDPWPAPPLGDADIETAAELLAQLHFLKCGICKKPLGPDGRRLFGVCYKVSRRDDRSRLPRSRHEAERIRKGNKTIVSLPGAHSACIKGEGLMADIMEASAKLDDAALGEQLEAVVDDLWGKIQEDNPAATRNEAIDTIEALYRAATQKEVGSDG